MRDLWDRVLNTPTSVRAGAGAITGVTLLGAVGLLFGFKALMVLTIGVLVIAAAVGVFLLVVKKRQRARAKALEGAITSDAANAPMDLSADERQRHEEARRKFELGLKKAREEGRGKLVGELPWYVVVGEPGSGKSMAIKRSGMEFPFGEQELQGAGGTLHMDWFFTDDAVLLDTAGNLLYERGDRDDATRWIDFLKRVKRFRKNAPINGVFLFLPVDTLLADSESDREEKAKRIAARLRMIQTELRVRCGVYIILSKADKITGFREFTEALQASPGAPRQMLGWSNPAPLDAPLDLSQVKGCLGQIESDLRRRRFDLLFQHQQGRFEDRLDEFDALFDLPNRVHELAAPLEGYLERIFGKGKWLQSSLFLRGIYLTSAEQKGSVIDTALARATGIPQEQLAGLPWSELDRSFFLRDMFLEKAFCEHGLVTHAEDIHKNYRQKKIIVVGSGVLAAVLLGLLSFWLVAQVNSSVKPPAAMWAGVESALDAWDPIEASVKMPADRGEARGLQIPGVVYAADQEMRYGRVPPPFSWLLFRVGGQDFADERERALARVYRDLGARPVLEQARARLQDEDVEPTVDQIEQLVNLEVNHALATNENADDDSEILPIKLARFKAMLSATATPPLDDESLNTALFGLDQLGEALSRPERRGVAVALAGNAPGTPGVSSGATKNNDSLDFVERAYEAYARTQLAQTQAELGRASRLGDAIDRFQNEARRVLAVDLSPARSSAVFDSRAQELGSRLEGLESAYADLAQLSEGLPGWLLEGTDYAEADKAWKARLAAVSAEAQAQLKQLGELYTTRVEPLCSPGSDAEASMVSTAGSQPEDGVRANIAPRVARLCVTADPASLSTSEITFITESQWQAMNLKTGSSQRAFEARFEAARRVIELAGEAALTEDGLGTWGRTPETTLGDPVLTGVDQLRRDSRLEGEAATWVNASADAIARRRRTAIVRDMAERLRNVPACVAGIAPEGDRYDPASAAAVGRLVAAMSGWARPEAGNPAAHPLLEEDAASLRSTIETSRANFLSYRDNEYWREWTRTRITDRLALWDTTPSQRASAVRERAALLQTIQDDIVRALDQVGYVVRSEPSPDSALITDVLANIDGVVTNGSLDESALRLRWKQHRETSISATADNLPHWFDRVYGGGLHQRQREYVVVSDPANSEVTIDVAGVSWRSQFERIWQKAAPPIPADTLCATLRRFPISINAEGDQLDPGGLERAAESIARLSRAEPGGARANTDPMPLTFVVNRVWGSDIRPACLDPERIEAVGDWIALCRNKSARIRLAIPGYTLLGDVLDDQEKERFTAAVSNRGTYVVTFGAGNSREAGYTSGWSDVGIDIRMSDWDQPLTMGMAGGEKGSTLTVRGLLSAAQRSGQRRDGWTLVSMPNGLWLGVRIDPGGRGIDEPYDLRSIPILSDFDESR